VDKPTKLPDLVVLGLLNEKPRYGYEIKTIIDHVMSHIIDVSSGSLYYTLKKLKEQELVEESAIEKVGRRPERSVYRITDKGKELLERDLPQVIFPHARPFFPIDLALYFFQFLDTKATSRRVKMRQAYLHKVLGYLEETEQKYAKAAPASHLFIIQHHKHFNQMEAGFLELMQKKLVKEDYKLSELDIAEVERELEMFKNRVRYETVLGGLDSGKK
jgi:DNA-binding PadR family transcriptional regulator